MNSTWIHTITSLTGVYYYVARPTRRQPVSRVSAIEGLESRALLSASSGPAAIAEVQSVNQVVENHMAPESDLELMELAETNLAAAPAMKIGKLNQAGKSAQQALPVYDFAGDWQLGVGGNQPSDDNRMQLEQKGNKIVGKISTGNSFDTVAKVRGRVTGNELDARFKILHQSGSGKGHFVVQKSSSSTFQGTIEVKHPGDPLVVLDLLGLQ